MRRFLKFIFYFSAFLLCMQMETFAQQGNNKDKSIKSSSDSTSVTSLDSGAKIKRDIPADDLNSNNSTTQQTSIPEKRTFIPWWIWLVIVVLILTNIFQIFKSTIQGLINRKQKPNRNPREEIENNRPTLDDRFTSDLYARKKLEKELAECKSENHKLKRNQEPLRDESSSPTKEWNNINGNREKKENIVFYAGIATAENVFTKISDLQNSEESIFKLTYTDAKRLEAKFEVLNTKDLGEIMKMKITNSPNEYLFRVCNNQNSTDEFQNEIVTLEKGTALKKGEDWCVDEDKKALIKFE